VDSFFFHSDRLYRLLAFVVMPNHVHLLLTPLAVERVAEGQAGKLDPQYVPLAKITQSLKGYTAREANQLLGRTGQPFWQDESYDHWARSEAEVGRIAIYIESDPVRSGIVTSVEDWRWSSAWERRQGRLGTPPVRE
jgi:REP element-mobilizing transposase RayT